MNTQRKAQGKEGNTEMEREKVCDRDRDTTREKDRERSPITEPLRLRLKGKKQQIEAEEKL